MDQNKTKPSLPRGCSRDSAPGFVGLDNVNYCFVAGVNNFSDPRLTKCCEGSQIGVIDNCYGWCVLPERYFAPNVSDGTQHNVSLAFYACLRQQETHDPGLAGCNLPRLKSAAATNSLMAGSGSSGTAVSAMVLGVVLWNMLF